jgi:hypothetical protein
MTPPLKTTKMPQVTGAKSTDTCLRVHKLHHFHLYQISGLGVKENLRTNYVIMRAFSMIQENKL